VKRTTLGISELGFSSAAVGMTFFDVSPFYGETAAETLLGKALHGLDRTRVAVRFAARAVEACFQPDRPGEPA
jgi:aryl-alcohol dehydrogenase-like predicted oxidoreductase